MIQTGSKMNISWVLVYFFSLLHWTATYIITTSTGTTKNLEEIFKGRCYEYQEVLNPSAFTDGKKNCTELWSLFSSAFQYKDPCNVRMEDYDRFIKAAYHDLPANSLLFWSGVFPFVNKFADRGLRYFTIADTLTGYLVDNLAFCGQLEPPGINYDTCPRWGSCELAGDISFWRRASVMFAEGAAGTVHVMLNATLSEAFRPTSIFAEYELVYLNSSKVSSLNTLLVRDIGVMYKETCGAGSLLELQTIAENNVGVQYECIDNPGAAKNLLCVDHADNPECSHSD